MTSHCFGAESSDRAGGESVNVHGTRTRHRMRLSRFSDPAKKPRRYATEHWRELRKGSRATRRDLPVAVRPPSIIRRERARELKTPAVRRVDMCVPVNEGARYWSLSDFIRLTRYRAATSRRSNTMATSGLASEGTTAPLCGSTSRRFELFELLMKASVPR